jgi:hypothetical protein
MSADEYKPPYVLTERIVDLVERIGEALGRVQGAVQGSPFDCCASGFGWNRWGFCAAGILPAFVDSLAPGQASRLRYEARGHVGEHVFVAFHSFAAKIRVHLCLSVDPLLCILRR